MSITNVHEIGLAIGFAIARDQTLTLEYDSGTVEAAGDDLYTAWEEYSLDDPFTIHTDMKD